MPLPSLSPLLFYATPDLRGLSRVLRLHDFARVPSPGRLLLDGSVNAFRDFFRQPRVNLPPAGTVRLHYVAADAAGLPPGALRRWFGRFSSVLAGAARRVYRNEDEPLAAKLPDALHVLFKQVNLIDLLALAGISLAAGLTAAFLAGCGRLAGLLRPRRSAAAASGAYARYAEAVRRASDLTARLSPAARHREERLAGIFRRPAPSSPIHLRWPQSLPDKNAVVGEGLWHVCPTNVFQVTTNPQGQPRIAVHHERCIRCEVCWRTSDLVDWGRDGRQRLVYPVFSPDPRWQTRAEIVAAAPRFDYWQEEARRRAEQLRADLTAPPDGQATHEVAELEGLLARLERKLFEFDLALAKEPRTIDRGRAEHLELLARYAQQLALPIVDLLRGSVWADSRHPGLSALHARLLDVATELAAQVETRARRAWDRRYAWAAADGRQLRQHHLVGLQHLLAVLRDHLAAPANELTPTRAWLRAEESSASAGVLSLEESALLVAGPLPPGQRDVLIRRLAAKVPALDLADLPRTLHAPERKGLLAELGRRDPDLACQVASHLWARDLARQVKDDPSFAEAADLWARGAERASLRVGHESTDRGVEDYQGALTVLLLHEDSLTILRAAVFSADEGEPGEDAGDPLGPQTAVDGHFLRRMWAILRTTDLTSIAFGIVDALCRRAQERAARRACFPGLFHDEQGRDSLARFGAVKKAVGRTAAWRYLLETLDRTCGAPDFSAASVDRARLAEALVAHGLGVGLAEWIGAASQSLGAAPGTGLDVLRRFWEVATCWHDGTGSPATVFREHGEQLLRATPEDVPAPAWPVESEALFADLAQRRGLQAELEEVYGQQARLIQAWKAWPAGGAVSDAPATAEVAELLGRGQAGLLASKALLLRTHARLEHGTDSEPELALTRVWLEITAAGVEVLEAAVRRSLDEPAPGDERPLVEPGAEPPVATLAAYLAATVAGETGDFLTSPVDLLRPRVVPEMRSGASQAALKAGDGAGLFPAAAVPAPRRRKAEWLLKTLAAVDPGYAARCVSSRYASGLPAWIRWRLQRLTEEDFVAGALAFEVAGRLVHRQVKAARLEWAVARLFLGEWRARTEALTAEVLDLAPPVAPGEPAYPDRDRFLILQSLVRDLAPRWARPGTRPAPAHLNRRVLALEALKDAFRRRVERGVALFGDDLWQNPNLQPSCFGLADAAAWLKAADCVLGRWAWLSRRTEGNESEEWTAPCQLAEAALARCVREVEHRLPRFDEELAHLRRGYYAPEIRAAALLLDPLAGPEQDLHPHSPATAAGAGEAGQAVSPRPIGTGPPEIGSSVE